MKYIFLLFTCTLLLSATKAQKPETVYGAARIHKPMSWYKEQSAAWKKVTEQEPKNNNAWYNYYYANRVLAYNDHEDKRSPQEKDAAIQAIISDMGKNIPDSYEYNICKWAAGGFNMELLPYLKKAAELGPDRTEHIDFMINIGETERNIKQRDQYSLRKFETGNISTGMLYYNYNVMMGLAPNAILLTCGDNDTYPIWALQAQGIRKDITVINLYLVRIDDYRNKLFTELGIGPMEINKSNDPKNHAEEAQKFRTGIIQHISKNKKNYPVYLGLTASGDGYTDSIQGDLYLTGLAYQYSQEPMDNMALLKRNFEQQYALDYIDRSFYNDISADVVKIINTNYLVPMLKLYDHYETAGDHQKKEWIKQKLLAVSKDTENDNEVKKHVNQ